ncbi:MAG: prepilin-type N-terminal cleavage/methylation domain-containing protein [Verrucomicrobiota bacterium]
MTRRRRERRAFSLIELLVTLALLLVISSMYFGFSSPTRQRSSKERCAGNLQKIFLAADLYARDHGGSFPAVSNALTAEEPLDLLVPQYTADRGVFICPGSKDAPLPSDAALVASKISYAYYMGRRSGGAATVLMSDAQVDTRAKAAGDAIFSTTGNPPGNKHHRFGGNLLFTDGHAEASPTNLAMALPLPAGVELLNPKP